MVFKVGDSVKVDLAFEGAFSDFAMDQIGTVLSTDGNVCSVEFPSGRERISAVCLKRVQ